MGRRGVSEVMATVVLLLLTIALGSLMVSIFVQSLPPTESRVPKFSEQVSITFLSNDTSYTYIHFYNYGGSYIQISEVYVDGVKKDFVCQVYESGQYVTVSNIPPQSAGYVRIPLTGVKFEVLLVTSNENLIFYHVGK